MMFMAGYSTAIPSGPQTRLGVQAACRRRHFVASIACPFGSRIWLAEMMTRHAGNRFLPLSMKTRFKLLVLLTAVSALAGSVLMLSPLAAPTLKKIQTLAQITADLRKGKNPS
jgi:hypothetical protein